MNTHAYDAMAERIEALERAVKELKGSSKIEDKSSELRVRVVDEATPINTVIRNIESNRLSYLRKYNGSNIDVLKSLLPDSMIANGCKTMLYVVDTKEDLRQRLFYNADPKYRWGAIDRDGLGAIYVNKPSRGDEDFYWVPCEEYQVIAKFPYYADEWDKILIERR